MNINTYNIRAGHQAAMADRTEVEVGRTTHEGHLYIASWGHDLSCRAWLHLRREGTAIHISLLTLQQPHMHNGLDR